MGLRCTEKEGGRIEFILGEEIFLGFAFGGWFCNGYLRVKVGKLDLLGERQVEVGGVKEDKWRLAVKEDKWTKRQPIHQIRSYFFFTFVCVRGKINVHCKSALLTDWAL